ncbi:hypothetical protein NE237_005866 [Protea cynaroides]|uniref:Pentatricopeptide repeat-containing protein n=1 Tax=Protea cynaroides TaxID=273540 RepID=A0A9Q0KLE4_9MAGN|nr:hypothetical protein NE237_005866 [Protea cynaroides]
MKLLLTGVKPNMFKTVHTCFVESELCPPTFVISVINQASVLLSCIKAKSLRRTQQIHAQILITSLFSHTHLANLTVQSYFKCREPNIAYQVLDRISERDSHSWSPAISFCSQNNEPEKALHFFRLMNLEGCDPNRSSLISCLNSCGNLSKLIEGKQIHTQVLKKIPPSDVIVGNILIDFYSKCGKFSEAAQAFDEIPVRDLVSWNSMLSCYSRNGQSGEAWELFAIMNVQGMEFSHQAFSVAAKACGELRDIKQGEQLHCLVLKSGFESHVVVASALLDMYVKHGFIAWSRKVFDSMAGTNVVSWTSIINGYVQIDEGEEALILFREQILVGVLPDAHSLSSILTACANIPALEFGKLVHACIIKLGYEFQVFAGNSLVAMYSRCGCLFDAQRTLDSMSVKNVITWTSMIGGYAQHGRATEALEMFDRMKAAGVEPNSITFVAVLSACSRSGLIEEGIQNFQSMKIEYGLEAGEEHYTCMVDLLARAGHVNEAEEFMKQMPFEPSASTWGALLNGCRSAGGELELGLKCAKELFRLEPKSASNHVLLANMYAANGRWEEMRRIRGLMKEKGLRKESGYSWIEIGKDVSIFGVGDNLHPQNHLIYSMLHHLSLAMFDAMESDSLPK